MSLEPRRLKAFRSWLRQRGVELREPTNRYEIVRFVSWGADGSPAVSVLYERENGRQTPTGRMAEALEAFATGGAWTPGIKRARRVALAPRVAALRLRDGDGCFYCGEPLDFETRSSYVIEHLCPLAHGGPNHLSNLALADRPCEQKAGALSVAEKVRLRDSLRRSKA